jgi:restriction endonuclease S subunit
VIKLSNAECVPSAQLGLHGTFPMPGDLRPNPDWAKLPLFDRKDWRTLPFAEFAESVNERVEPSEAAEEIYVGLEHLDSQNLHIRRWGKGSDVIGTKLRFRKGDIIFGRRRAYQRKLAVAEFDGICSAHAMVVRAKPDVVLPEFLPFLMMSDRFMNRAVEISVGSLSPTINWKTLKLQEFDLPPLDKQRRIAEMLWAVDEAERRTSDLLDGLGCVKAATFDKSVSPAFAAGQAISLASGCHRVTDGTHQPPKFTEEGIPFFFVKTISSGHVDWKHTKFVSQQTYGELTKKVCPKRGDVLYTAVGTYGVAMTIDFDQPFVFQRHIAHIIPNHEVFDSGYLTLFLNSSQGKRQSDKAAIGSAQPTVTLSSLCLFQVPCPSIKEQKQIVARIRSFDAVKEFAEHSLDFLRNIICYMLNEVIR